MTQLLVGPDHPDVASSMTDLALLYREQGKLNDAEPLLQQAVFVREKTPGNMADLANSMNNLARLYRDSGRYSEAEPLYKQSLALRQQALGPDDLSVAASLRNYALLLREMKRDAEADQMDAKAKVIEDKSGAQ